MKVPKFEAGCGRLPRNRGLEREVKSRDGRPKSYEIVRSEEHFENSLIDTAEACPKNICCVPHQNANNSLSKWGDTAVAEVLFGYDTGTALSMGDSAVCQTCCMGPNFPNGEPKKTHCKVKFHDTEKRQEVTESEYEMTTVLCQTVVDTGSNTKTGDAEHQGDKTKVTPHHTVDECADPCESTKAPVEWPYTCTETKQTGVWQEVGCTGGSGVRGCEPRRVLRTLSPLSAMIGVVCAQETLSNFQKSVGQRLKSKRRTTHEHDIHADVCKEPLCSCELSQVTDGEHHSAKNDTSVGMTIPLLSKDVTANAIISLTVCARETALSNCVGKKADWS